MRLHGFPAVLFIVLIIGTEPTGAQSPAPPPHAPGNSFVASLDQSIRASKSRPGDSVHLRIAHAFLFGHEVVPVGARVSAHVVSAKTFDKQAKTEALLGVAADRISWKHRSIPVRAWIVGFVSRKITTTYSSIPSGFSMDRIWWEKFNETTDKPSHDSTYETMGTRGFSRLDPNAHTSNLDANVFVGHLKVRRNLSADLGAALVHDDGDVKLPKGLLVVMEQITTHELGS